MMCRNLSAVQSYVFWMPLLPTKHSCTTQFKTIQTRQELFSAALVMNSEEAILWCIPSHLFYGFLPPVIIMYTHTVQKASCSRPTSYNCNSKTRGWSYRWTKKKGRNKFGKIRRIAVNLQDMQRKEYKKQNKTKWDIKNGEKQCNKLDLL